MSIEQQVNQVMDAFEAGTAGEDEALAMLTESSGLAEPEAAWLLIRARRERQEMAALQEWIGGGWAR